MHLWKISPTTEHSLGKLRSRFSHLWQRHSVVENHEIGLEVFTRLSEKYQEPWRSYHNLNHIQECLNHFDSCKDQADFADSIEFAIWFHDCIYEVGADDNEIRSRDFFLDESEGFLNNSLRTVVAELIIDTSRRCEPDSSDGKLLADIDLTSFGLPWQQYMKDSEDVQNELLHKDHPDSNSGKVEFLQSLVSKENIYYSRYYLDRYEVTAKQNIQDHLKLLAG